MSLCTAKQFRSRVWGPINQSIDVLLPLFQRLHTAGLATAVAARNAEGPPIDLHSMIVLTRCENLDELL